MEKMIKKLFENNQALTIYIVVQIGVIFIPLSKLLLYVLAADTYNCYYELGSFRTYECGLSEFLFGSTFLWPTIVLFLFLQILLIPATVVTYGLIEYLKQKYSKFNKLRLGLKYLFALVVYALIVALVAFAVQFLK